MLFHRQAGAGAPIVLLHGNPVHSYVWRKLMPLLPGRVLAPDLIGMGASPKPDLAYTFDDHRSHLDAWFASMDLRDAIVVGYDWGGVLALDWASRHEDRVRGVAVFETMLASGRWADMPAQGQELFRALRTPGVGEQLVLEQNGFLARSLEHGVRTGLTDEDRAAYAAPFPDPRSRKPMLAWTRMLPLDDEPAEIMAVIAHNRAWLERTQVAKLLLTFDGNGLSNSPGVVAWATQHMTVRALGAAGHHAPEDAPQAIADALRQWAPQQR